MIECGCVPYFDSFVNNTVSVLSVGNLVSNTCVFDEYVIDWFRDGEHAMVSGKGYDPDIEAFHPFLGDESIPVVGGQWKPVLRYVVIGGVKMYPTPKKCQNWCADLDVELPSINVPFISVTNVGCGVKGGIPDTGYDYRIAYTTSQDFSQATRTVRFFLDSDTAYVALRFYAYQVADLLEVFYNEETTPIHAYILGTNLPSYNKNAVPEEIDWNVLSIVVNLTERTYEAGDYLTIKVYPSVKEPGNYNTIWSVHFKCLPAGTFDCSMFTPDKRQIDYSTVDVSYNSTYCRFEFKFKFVGHLLTPTFTSSAVYRYFGLTISNTTQTSYNTTTNEQVIWLNAKVGATQTATTNRAVRNAEGVVTFTKSGNIFTIECTSQTDYDIIKNSYNLALNNPNISNYSPDNTEVNHYKTFAIFLNMTDGVCGDAYTSKSATFHYSSVVTFNDGAKTVQINAVNTTLGITEQPCNDTYITANSIYYSVQNSLNQADFSLTTGCIQNYPFVGYYLRVFNDFQLSRTIVKQVYYQSRSQDTVCNHTLFHERSSWHYIFYLLYLQVIITDESDPINNFRFASMVDPNSPDLYSSYQTIYEKSGGTVIIP